MHSEFLTAPCSGLALGDSQTPTRLLTHSHSSAGQRRRRSTGRRKLVVQDTGREVA